MQGLELSRRYYEQYGAPMLREQFPELLPLIAVGLFGSGSECFGFDDDLSRDHDFSPDFCIFLPGEDRVNRQTAFRLERAYTKLPKEFEGVRRPLLAPVGGERRGVLRTAEFFTEKTGTPDGDLTLLQWLQLPAHYLAEAVNGKVWYDGLGEVTAIRQRLSLLPEDVRRKQLAGHLLLMAQAGQYNFPRCLAHGEGGAAQLAVYEFVRHTLAAVFLLNRVHLPFYKWQLRALRGLPLLGDLGEDLELLLTTDNGPVMGKAKEGLIEDLAGRVIRALQDQGLTEAVCGDLEKHARSVQDGVKDPEIRNLHILAGI